MLYVSVFSFLISQKQIGAEEIVLISYVIFFVLTLAVVFVVFFLTFQRRKNQLLLDKINQQKAFDEELVKSQQEIQEETLKHVGRELHDNVGQLLSYASMQLNSVVNNAPDDLKSRATEASSALSESLTEVRALSKSLNSDVIFNLGFEATLKNEIKRLDKIGEFTSKLQIEGEKQEFENQQDQIILFRILQEFFSNTLKYAEADTLNVNLSYTPERLLIKAEDNGIGFDLNIEEKGSGLINMQKRAEMINAKFQLSSKNGEGTSLELDYPFAK